MAAISDLNFEVDIAALTPGQPALWGFRSGNRGTHTSRTIMLDELSHLLYVVRGDAVCEDYAEAVMAHNCLAKRTAATRKLSLQRLIELYALDPQVILFRVLRDLWGRNENSRPLLALLLTLARDPLLRATATAVVRNASSSWTQSGHFRGRGRKVRQRVVATPAAATFALLLGFAVVCCSGHLGQPCSIRAPTISSMWRSTPND